jgi:hypothetical protein
MDGGADVQSGTGDPAFLRSFIPLSAVIVQRRDQPCRDGIRSEILKEVMVILVGLQYDGSRKALEYTSCGTLYV